MIEQRDQIIEICRNCNAREVRQAKDAGERQRLWKARKQAFGAVGRLAPSYCTQDGVVPRTKLPHMLRRITEIGTKYNVRIVNVFHAGDGNIHPILLFDERDHEQIGRVLRASEEILDECLACGGSVTGEHGIGVEKIAFMAKMFTSDDLAVMERYRQALNPRGNLSPAKMLPTAGACGIEQRHPGRHGTLIHRETFESITHHQYRVTPDRRGSVRHHGPVRFAAHAGLSGWRRYGIDYGLVPKAPGIGLSLAGLARVMDYPARYDRYGGSGNPDERSGEPAGKPTPAPACGRAQAGQATLGGLIATNTSGPRRYGNGTLRDYVIGIGAVDGHPTAFKAGGRVVKNVAGYDFCRLLVGSLGTLAVITQVTLKVKPLPERSGFVVSPFADFHHAELMLEVISKSGTAPAAIELLMGPAWKNDPALGDLRQASAGFLAIGVEGTELEARWMTETLITELSSIEHASPRTS